MFLELIATFVAGIAGAGIMMLLNRITGNRLPRWLVPVAAGAAMLTMTISSEYAWYGRTTQNMPDRLEVIETVESRAAYRPWTYVVPYINRFIALDRAGVQANAEQPQMRLADLLFYGRWKPTTAVQIMVDCDRNARADPGESGLETQNLRWREVGADDPFVASICKEG
ncbi:hypothetical protein [Primorskyibacter marinus]|uniref:hypothetical protein n=1 Tax=Primorskyibacter marinus TaxID=1977320 RepID=UPI000E3032AE|nr:hypothetical protein [Primorskyibacter marinus]